MGAFELSPGLARGMAEVVLVLHFAFVVFVVGGLALVWVGHGLGWRFVDRMAFRVLHGAAIGIVVVQAWLGLDCPLTVLESALRARAGTPGLGEGEAFVANWLSRLLYFDAPDRVFVLLYTGFGLAVAATAWRFPPVRRPRPPAPRGDG